MQVAAGMHAERGGAAGPRTAHLALPPAARRPVGHTGAPEAVHEEAGAVCKLLASLQAEPGALAGSPRRSALQGGQACWSCFCTRPESDRWQAFGERVRKIWRRRRRSTLSRAGQLRLRLLPRIS